MSRRLPMILVGCAAVILLSYAAWPLRKAWFTADDYSMIALVRHNTNPLWFFVADPFATYMYRPIGMLLWSVSVSVFGNSSLAHYGISVTLHAAVACALGFMVYQATRQSRIALCAGVLFAVNPGALKTAAWLSDRFDLLAALFCLLALIAAGKPASGRRNWWLIPVAATASAFSKETAFILLPLLGLRIWSLPGLTKRFAHKILAISALPFVWVLIAHRWLLADFESRYTATHLSGSALRGSTSWLAHWPDAIAGHPVADATSAFLGAAMLLVALGLCWLAFAHRVGRRWAVIAGILWSGPMVLQAPIWQEYVPHEDPLSSPYNYRFYYLAGLGFALALSLAASTLRRTPARTGSALCIVLLAIIWSATTARAEMKTWADSTGKAERRVVEAAGALASTLKPEAPCTVFFLGTSGESNLFQLVSDAAVKSALPEGHPGMRCVFVTERSPWFLITAETPRTDRVWQPFTARTNRAHLPMHAKSFGTLCIHHFDQLEPGLRVATPNPVLLHWEGNGFRRGLDLPGDAKAATDDQSTNGRVAHPQND